MAVIHISEAEAARDLAGLLARVREGAEVVIDDGLAVEVVLRASGVKPRTLAEAIALLPNDSIGVMDEDFARDVQAGIDAHRDDFIASAWD